MVFLLFLGRVGSWFSLESPCGIQSLGWFFFLLKPYLVIFNIVDLLINGLPPLDGVRTRDGLLEHARIICEVRAFGEMSVSNWLNSEVLVAQNSANRSLRSRN